MKKLLIILPLMLLLAGCVWAENDTVELNGVEFELPVKYQGGEFYNNKYVIEDEFSIRCIDDDVSKAIGLWACENDYSKDLKIKNHPVRHYSQYNQYVKDNQSHAYFASDMSVYEITWRGEKITPEIKKIIRNTPPSKIDDDTFYAVLDEAVKIYKQERTDKLNHEAEYNYLEAKYQSQYTHDTPDDTRFKEILLTRYYQ